MQARKLRDAGWSIRAIGTRLGIGNATVVRDLESVPGVFRLVPGTEIKRNTSGTAEVIPIRRSS
jgi:hypothetical protein